MNHALRSSLSLVDFPQSLHGKLRTDGLSVALNRGRQPRRPEWRGLRFGEPTRNVIVNPVRVSRHAVAVAPRLPRGR